ncbi:O-antigen ligase family protein [Maribacter sp. CXY002]|uniref:O-antigen ligase family protein n=1 Tax=Maribacter luteocoastalis TaxID=3407671 RepID=UPI003B680FCA
MKKLKKFFGQFNALQWSAIFFSISFGFGMAVNSIGFFLFCLTGFSYSIIDFRNNELLVKSEILLYVTIGYFGLIVVREVFANISTTLDIIYYNLPFLFIPIIFLFQSIRLTKCKEAVFIAFLAGMVLNAIVNLSFGIYRGILVWENGISFWYFTYNFLSEPFGIQPIYLGYFYVIALLILFHFKGYIKISLLFYFIITLLTLSIFLLAARNAILSMIILMPFYLFISKTISIKKAFIFLGIVIICFIGALQNPVVKNRIMKVSNKGNFYSGSSLRSNIWQSALSVSNKNFVWGLGEDKAGLLLHKEFEKRGLEVPLKYKYHSHNQFLHTLIQYGAMGVVFLITLFIIAIWTAWKNENYLGLTFTLLFLLTIMTEAVFTRQWGQLSYVYFTCWLVFSLKNDKGLNTYHIFRLQQKV